MTKDNTMSTLPPAHLVAHPGDLLEEWLDERNMTQRELAARMAVSEKFVSQLINGKAALTPDTAFSLELVTSIAAPTWLRMEADYQAVARRNRAHADDAFESPFEGALVKTLRDAGVISAPRGQRNAQAIEIFRLLGVASTSGLHSLAIRHATAFRTSRAFVPDPVATEVAIALVRAQAPLIETDTFDPVRVTSVLTELRSATRLEPREGAFRARELLRTAGVALVFIPAIPKAHCNGLTLWQDGTPIVGISDRGKREDIFWFTLFHELFHVLEGDRTQIFLNGAGESTDDETEDRADHFAAETLIPSAGTSALASIQSFDDLSRVARALGVSEGVVVGALHHQGYKPHAWGTSWVRRIEIGSGSPRDQN